MAIAFDKTIGNVTNAATLTTSAAAVSGSRIVMFVWWFGAQTCTGATGGSLTWVIDKQVRHSGLDSNQAILSADAPSGLASSTVLTPTFSDTPDSGPGIAALSATGLATGASGYVDTTSAIVEDFEEAWTTNNLVTTNADDFLVAFSIGESGTSNTPSGSTTEVHDWTAEGSQFGTTGYRIVSSTSTYTLTGTWSTEVGFQQNIAVAYKGAAAGGPYDLTLSTETDSAQALNYGFPPVQNEPETLRIVRSGTVYR